MNLESLGRKHARLVTDAVVRRPSLWRLFRPLMRRQFDGLAPSWDGSRSPDYLAPYRAALDGLPVAPRRALDLGTGTGLGARAIATRFPDADVLGVDLSAAMVDEARKLGGSPRYETADGSHLTYADDAFDLVALCNMIPFFDELARVVAPGGHVLVAFSSGSATPIYVPGERLRDELGARGFMDFADFSAGRGTALLARKGDRT